MKVINLNQAKSLQATEKLIKDVLNRDIDAFKATSKQFLRNNKNYFTDFNGMLA